MNGNDAKLTGSTRDKAVKARLDDTFKTGLPGVLQGAATILHGPVTVTEAMLRPVLDEFSRLRPARPRAGAADRLRLGRDDHRLGPGQFDNGPGRRFSRR